MKPSFSKQLIARLLPYVCIYTTQLGAATASAQTTPYNNVYNNVNQSFININISGGPNVRGISVQQGIILSHTNVNIGSRRQTANITQTAVRPVTRRSGTSSPVVRRQPPASQGTQSRAAVRPVANAVTAPVAMQAPSQIAVSIGNAAFENVVPPVEQVVQNNDMLVQSNPVAMVPVPSSNVQGSNAARRNTGSFSAVSFSVKSSSRRSKKKKHGGFYYAANKKVMKFFATKRKGKIDPAKCFVWR